MIHAQMAQTNLEVELKQYEQSLQINNNASHYYSGANQKSNQDEMYAIMQKKFNTIRDEIGLNNKDNVEEDDRALE